MADTTVNVTRTCVLCRRDITLSVPTKEWMAWDDGRGPLIQDALPSLTPVERDLILTGLCGECMGPDEDTEPGALIIIAGDPDDIEIMARAAGYVGAERPGDTEPTPEVANPTLSGVTLSHSDPVLDPPAVAPGPLAEIHSRVLAGKTFQGEDATRGHLSAPHIDWPRCSTVMPTVRSPLFDVEPLLCNRPATLLASFTTAYLDACARHECDNPACPVQMIGRDPEIREQALAQQVPVCGLHLAKLREDETRFQREVVGLPGGVFHLTVIGIESVTADGAEVLDLRHTLK